MITRLIRIFVLSLTAFGYLAGDANKQIDSCHCRILTFDPALLVNGQFTTESLKNFLVKAYIEQKILDPAFSPEHCLIVENLAGQGGVLTGQLFLVKSVWSKKEQEYIIKELIAGEQEIYHLALAANYEPLYPYIAPNMVKDFPVIYLPIAYLCYNFGDKDYYFSVMPKARGQEFLKIMNAYIAYPTQENKQNLEKAYATLGRTLGNFHKAFMMPDQNSLKGTTLVHGDFHIRNFFYDPTTDAIYWIDNECLGAATVRPQSIRVDIQDVLFKHFYQDDWFGFDQNIRNNPKPWVKKFYPIFFDHYLDAFGGDKNIHAQELQEILTEMQDTYLQELSNVALVFY